MTAPDSLPLHALTEDNLAAASPDLLRAMVKTFTDALMSAEADAMCNAEYGQVSDERVNPQRIPVGLEKSTLQVMPCNGIADGTAEDARTEEAASLEVVRRDGRLVGAWRKLIAGSMGAVLVVVPYVGGGQRIRLKPCHPPPAYVRFANGVAGLPVPR
ncbi:Transposase, Mutator family [Actinacidiphila paucisporea]|uniref:Transposase, Mutator family n=1 Tax=Actinacidiphila paucisporea TaxID=310782 RepID=A0A1M7QW72_9ACTN|nr:Transposase, Mutator family [Actinacidiphila paucisporea]